MPSKFHPGDRVQYAKAFLRKHDIPAEPGDRGTVLQVTPLANRGVCKVRIEWSRPELHETHSALSCNLEHARQ